MTTITQSPVNIQTSAESIPAIPTWFGEFTLLAHHLSRQKILERINERVRFARRRFGRYDVIDFVAVLFGYAISGERTLEAFYQQLEPWASAFMALFGRDRLPARSTLSRFLSSLDQATVEFLRSLFLQDLLVRPLVKEGQSDGEGLWDRQGNRFLVFDIDGTREAARQRALPKGDDLPLTFRRLDGICAPGYTGRKRGEVVRTRTTVLHMHTHQWFGSFGNPGNGRYRQELQRARAAIEQYLAAYQWQPSRTLLRVDGQYGTKAVLADLVPFCFVTRGKDYAVLKRPDIQRRLHLPADQQLSRPESDLVRTLYDCPDLPLGSDGSRLRVVVATHKAAGKKSRIGLTRGGVVYELFFTNLPQQGFTASDVVALYLHRGAFELALSDEDREIDPDRWCSHSAWGQEVWQIVSQWVWNVRLELGHQVEPTPVRTTELAPALPSPSSSQAAAAPSLGYAAPQVGLPWKAGRFSGQDFVLQPDGTLRCPADQTLVAHEQRREADGSLRVDVLERALGMCLPRLLYLTPTFHNPTGALLSHARRRKVVSLAKEFTFPIIEDNAFADLTITGETPPLLANFASEEAVVTLGSMNKLFWQGLRVGWIRAPEALIRRLGRLKVIADLGTGSLTQAVALQLLQHVEEVKMRRQRQLQAQFALVTTLLREHLPAWTWTTPAGGFFLWVRLPFGDASEFAQLALRFAVVVTPGAVMSVDESHQQYLRLPFLLAPDVLEKGIQRLAQAWNMYGQLARARHGSLDEIV